MPLTFRASNSFLSINSMKKNCVEIKKIKGKISNIIDGEFRKAEIIGIKKLEFKSLKKLISSRRLNIIIREKKIKEIKKIFFRKILFKKIKIDLNICYFSLITLADK